MKEGQFANLRRQRRTGEAEERFFFFEKHYPELVKLEH